MMLFCSKLFALPCYPLGLALLLLAGGVVLLFLRKRKTGLILVLCAGIGLYLFSFDPFSYLLVRSLEKRYNPSLTFPPASAIVLLCGGETPQKPPRLYDEINDAGDRILYAARLLKQGAAPRLIITGGSIPFLRSTAKSQAETAFRIIADMGMADTATIMLETKSRNTYENGVNTKALLDSLKLPPSIILVTSAMHMPRSVAIFKKLGCTVYPAPTDYRADVPYQLKVVNLFPTADVLYNSSYALHEIYGILAYKLLGRL
jgi:uncharacterized SAM-binding protein YcdF (DUF218 family)